MCCSFHLSALCDEILSSNHVSDVNHSTNDIHSLSLFVYAYNNNTIYLLQSSYDRLIVVLCVFDKKNKTSSKQNRMINSYSQRNQKKKTKNNDKTAELITRILFIRAVQRVVFVAFFFLLRF